MTHTGPQSPRTQFSLSSVSSVSSSLSLPFTSAFSTPVFTSCSNQTPPQQPIQSKPFVQAQQMPSVKPIQQQQQPSVHQPVIAQQQQQQQQQQPTFMRQGSNQGMQQQQQQNESNNYSVLAEWSPTTTDDNDEINQAAQTLASMAASVSTVPSTGSTWVPPPGSTTDSGSDTTSPRPHILG